MLSPVSGRDVRTAQPRLQLPFVRHQLELDAGCRYADVAGAVEIPRAGKRKRRGLRRAERGQENDALAGRLDRKLRQLVPGCLVQAGAGVEENLQPAEKIASQCLIGTKMRDKSLVALRNIEIDSGSNLTQIAYGLRHARWRRIAVVDVEGAAACQHHIEIVVTAEGVTPREPVDHDRWFVGDEGEAGGEHRLVRAQHAVCVDDGLGAPGRA